MAYPVVDTTGTLPALLDLHRQADKLSVQMGGIERSLRDLIAVCTPVELEQHSSTSNALEASRIVAAGQTRLWGFSGTNTKASAQFILAFDAVGIPANGAIPKFVMSAAASSDFWVSWTPSYRKFNDGVVLCNSSTSSTLTIGSADCWFDAQYTPFP
jgi:hypothetical protein